MVLRLEDKAPRMGFEPTSPCGHWIITVPHVPEELCSP